MLMLLELQSPTHHSSGIGLRQPFNSKVNHLSEISQLTIACVQFTARLLELH